VLELADATRRTWRRLLEPLKVVLRHVGDLKQLLHFGEECTLVRRLHLQTAVLALDVCDVLGDGLGLVSGYEVKKILTFSCIR
jgi:hypothetical protein